MPYAGLYTSLINPCNHEEADTRIFVHLQDAQQEQGMNRAIMYTIDTVSNTWEQMFNPVQSIASAEQCGWNYNEVVRGLSFEQRIYSYRLSRARRVEENAFGILTNRFRVFLSPLMISPETADKMVLASCVMHNFLREKAPSRYTPIRSFGIEDVDEGNICDVSWRAEQGNLQSIIISSSNNYKKNSK
eukprot:gene3556-2239_t